MGQLALGNTLVKYVLASQERLEIQINLKLLYTKPGESNEMR